MPTDINFLPAEDRPKRKPMVPLEPKPVEFFNPAAEKKEKITGQSGSGAKIKKAFSQFFKKKSGEPGADNIAAKDQSSLTPSASGFNVKEARDDLLRQIKNKKFGEEKAAVEMAPAKQQAEIKKVPDKAIGVNFSGKDLKQKLPDKNKRPWFGFFKIWLKMLAQRREKNKIKQQAAKLERTDIKAIKIKTEAIPPIAPSEIKIESKPVLPKTIKSGPEFLDEKPKVTEGQTSIAGPALAVGQDILKTNLISGQEWSFFDWSKIIKINITAIILAVLFVAGAWGLFSWLGAQEAPLSDIETKIITQRQEKDNLTAAVERISSLRARVVVVKELLRSHVYWTKFFAYLENNTLPGVYYKEFEGDLSGEYVLPVQTSDYKTFGAQMKTWEEEKNYLVSASAVAAEMKKEKQSAESGAGEKETVSFEINLKVNPNIFKQN
ncbi:MAG: hypothetical protein M0Q92_00540 [Methanoregula sp.]|jgi:hypothetical protein|nr:hypothetical protein [Methanoregula sp.]